MKYLVSFGRFWWDFVVGDDWIAAALVVVAIGATAAVAASDIAAWWVMPLAVVVVLGVSLRRAAGPS
ncbi:MAG TPA: hypothetical protein VGG88_00055 [Gaiellaceae bacterium]